MKRGLCPAILSLLIALFSLLHTAPTTFAAPRQVMVVHKMTAASVGARGGPCGSRCTSVFNQSFHGNSYSHTHLTVKGNNQNNGGNQGNNRGYNANYGANAGNLTVNRGKSRFTSINQHFSGNSYSWDPQEFIGHNLNNTGNQGHNSGHNVNYGANAGNLIINQNSSSHSIRVKQFFVGTGYSHNRNIFVGSNSNNTGNQGWNRGINEDHGGNAGNQIVN